MNSSSPVLEVIHSVELLNASQKAEIPYSSKNTHGWLDKNGWNYEKVYIQVAKTGDIYLAILSIANTEDGKKYLYDIDDINKEALNFLTQSELNRIVNIAQNGQLSTSKYTLPQNVSKVNTQNSYDVKKYDEAVKEGNIEKAQEQVDKKAIEWGAFSEDGKTPLRFYHGTQNFGHTTFKTKSNKTFFTSDINTAQTYSGMACIAIQHIT